MNDELERIERYIDHARGMIGYKMDHTIGDKSDLFSLLFQLDEVGRRLPKKEYVPFSDRKTIKGTDDDIYWSLMGALGAAVTLGDRKLVIDLDYAVYKFHSIMGVSK